MTKKTSKIDRSAVFQAILGDLEEQPEAPSQSEDLQQPKVTEQFVATEARFQEVPIERIVFNPQQPRSHFSQDSLTDLANSIKEHGVLEPILLRPVGNELEVIAGERRTRAAKLAGLVSIPGQILDVNDVEAFELSIIENLQREDLNPVEETDGIVRLIASLLNVTSDTAITLLQEAYNRARGRKTSLASEDQLAIITEIFERIGRFSVTSFVSNRIPILSFPEEVKDAVRSGQLEFTKAQVLARIDDPSTQSALLEATIRERLSLSQLRRRIAEIRDSDQIEFGAKQGIFSDSKEANQLLREVRGHLNVRTITRLDGRVQAEIARLLSQLNKYFED